MQAVAASAVRAVPAAARRPPPGLAPSWASEALGAHLWDRHARRWLDMSGAAPLGHADPRVEAAAACPPPDAEARAAARLLAPLPGADAARFLASPEAALDAAVALAVRATDRTEVVLLPVGAPPPRLGCDVAAVIAPPETLTASLRAAADAAGALLVLDERLAGPRRGEGGAQRQAGVRADLAMWGPAIANGRPLGALTGAAELLRHLPETPPAAPAALAAADAALARFAREPVALHLAVRGAELQAVLESIVASAGLGGVLRVAGDPTWIGLEPVGDPRLARRLVAQLAARGVHAPGALAVSYRHEDAEVGALLDACAAALAVVAAAPEAVAVAA